MDRRTERPDRAAEACEAGYLRGGYVQTDTCAAEDRARRNAAGRMSHAKVAFIATPMSCFQNS